MLFICCFNSIVKRKRVFFLDHLWVKKVAAKMFPASY